RLATVATLPPSCSQAAATFFSSAALLAQSTTLAPALASTFAASAPNAPVAPVTIAVLPRMSNRESGFFRKSSDMTHSQRRRFSTVIAGLEPAIHHLRKTMDARVNGVPADFVGGVPRPAHDGVCSLAIDITSAASTPRPAWSRPRCRD